jgi:hypothetical protein
MDDIDFSLTCENNLTRACDGTFAPQRRFALAQQATDRGPCRVSLRAAAESHRSVISAFYLGAATKKGGLSAALLFTF